MAETNDNIETPVTEDASASLGNVKFGKGCDLDINITDNIDFGPGQFSVIARQKQYNESQGKPDDNREEETLMMKGGACYMRPATFVGNDLIGDAYMSAEDAEAKTVEVGGVKAGISKKQLMNDYHGSISKVLDAILFPDTEFKPIDPDAPSLTVNKTTVAHDTAMSSLTFTFSNAANNLGGFNFAKNKSGNIVKNGTLYESCIDPSIPAGVKYGTAEDSISTAYNANTTLTVGETGADRTYYFQTSHTLTGYKFTGEDALTPCSLKGVETTISGYEDNAPLDSTVAKVTVQAPFYGGSVKTGLASNMFNNDASNYDTDKIASIVSQVLDQTASNPFSRANNNKAFNVTFTKTSTEYNAYVFLFPTSFTIKAVYSDHKGSETIDSMKEPIGTTTLNGITYNVWTPTALGLTDTVYYRVVLN